MNIINPSTEELIKEIEEHSQESVQQSYESLKFGQVSWANETIDHRISCIEKFMNLLTENIDSLSETLTSEVGKPLNQSKNEINGAAGRIEYFIQNSKDILATRSVVTEPNLEEEVSFEPLGVIANISAWNYPYLIGVNVFIPALIAGNSVLYKPSEFSTLTGLEIEKLMIESGVPENVYKCIVGTGQVGQYLLDLPLDGYFFTGSHKTGQYIYEQVAPKMVPCQMELGGKDPMYISKNINDVKNTAIGAAEGAYYNNGQSCCAVERIYVHESHYDQFVEAFVEEVNSYSVGKSTEDGVFIGPLTRENQIQVLKNQVDDAVKKGATLKLGGDKIDGKGYYFQPTVLTNVNHDMLVMKEESFGPIIGIQSVKDNEEAIQLMTDTSYGLTSAIYTTDKEEFKTIGKAMNSGTVYWNCCDRVSANVPWSGRGQSGFGSTLSEEGIKAFVKPKAWQMRF